jgi:hypothetical protein
MRGRHACHNMSMIPLGYAHANDNVIDVKKQEIDIDESGQFV